MCAKLSNNLKATRVVRQCTLSAWSQLIDHSVHGLLLRYWSEAQDFQFFIKKKISGKLTLYKDKKNTKPGENQITKIQFEPQAVWSFYITVRVCLNQQVLSFASLLSSHRRPELEGPEDLAESKEHTSLTVDAYPSSK